MGPPAHEVEPNGPWRVGLSDPIISSMSERDLHRIEDELAETWVEDWAGAGIAELEEYLAKHAAFQIFLEGPEAPAP
jgi:hypothetical protein